MTWCRRGRSRRASQPRTQVRRCACMRVCALMCVCVRFCACPEAARVQPPPSPPAPLCAPIHTQARSCTRSPRWACGCPPSPRAFVHHPLLCTNPSVHQPCTQARSCTRSPRRACGRPATGTHGWQSAQRSCQATGWSWSLCTAMTGACSVRARAVNIRAGVCVRLWRARAVYGRVRWMLLLVFVRDCNRCMQWGCCKGGRVGG